MDHYAIRMVSFRCTQCSMTGEGLDNEPMQIALSHHSHSHSMIDSFDRLAWTQEPLPFTSRPDEASELRSGGAATRTHFGR